MARNAPGKHFRKGITLLELTELFPTERSARRWFESQRWPDGPYCPRCGSFDVQSRIRHPSMTHRCRDCPERSMFSLKSGTLMQGSKLPYRTWLYAIYLIVTSAKGVSSLKLHRDLGVTQRTA